ncbi:hypothetical protein K2173_024895 [Erythroxylum novogranatense]|uniref:Uncharacterized protein n=1 Tax=Erythroxylum novogranatense TaxID=1862640 RepID=A0AAV8UCP2_9ROSI|nr:hypothetical protein K2173_024895 [Erythroxylum novogranatense]
MGIAKREVERQYECSAQDSNRMYSDLDPYVLRCVEGVITAVPTAVLNQSWMFLGFSVYMEMATTMTIFNYPRVSKLPPKECLGTGAAVLNVAVCFQQNACAFGRRLSYQCSYVQVTEPFLVNYFGRIAWRIRSSVNDGGLDSSTSGGTRGTRLVRAFQSLQTRLSAKFQEIRENLPVKLLFFLVGFYCATALATDTVIGQIGDWDIVSAALVVLVVEGIGALVYRASLPLFDKIGGLVTMFNYWKAGLTLGLFL